MRENIFYWDENIFLRLSNRFCILFWAGKTQFSSYNHSEILNTDIKS